MQTDFILFFSFVGKFDESFLFGTVFKCKYVTCDYSLWSSWSISCGRGMKRKKTLTKQNDHITEQQGGCSGLQTTCDKEKVETKDMDCE